MDIALVPATDADREFLYELHCATMREHIERTWGWDEAWQRADFDRRLREGAPQLIMVGRERVGAVEVTDNGREVLIANIHVLPSRQRHGIGSSVLKRIIAQASERGRDVGLQVLETNTDARKLYERLGFIVTASAPPHVRMTRSHRPRTS